MKIPQLHASSGMYIREFKNEFFISTINFEVILNVYVAFERTIITDKQINSRFIIKQVNKDIG